MENLDVAGQLILELLSDRSPELGARLKQRLNAALIDRGLSLFAEKAYGFRRFSDFLQGVLGDKVSIERPEGAGDIQVALVHAQAPMNPGSAVSSIKSADLSPIIRSDVWQAFTNPDPKRIRYLQRETREIRHFLENSSEDARRTIAENPDQFIQIEPIGSLNQAAWMREFLDSIKLPVNQRAPLEALVAEAYSSGLNATFTRALGEHGNAWRNYRTNLVIATIRDWAKQHKVRFDDLSVKPGAKEPAFAQDPSNQVRLSARQQAVKLLELLTEEDIARLVIPTLLSTILIKSRL